MERSRAYPVVSLEQALLDATRVQDELGKGVHDRASVATALGYSSGLGLAARKVAALVHFGLMHRLPDASYELSELARSLAHPRNEAERVQLLRQAALNPKLFAELNDNLKPNGRLPAQLANLLVRDYGITKNVAEDVAKIFRESMSFAGLLDESGHFVGSDESPSAASEGVEKTTASPTAGVAHRAGSSSAEPTAQSTSSSNDRVLEISLSQGLASLRLPRGLSGLDIRKLKKMIELLELDVPAD